jgi:hypothetical protein
MRDDHAVPHMKKIEHAVVNVATLDSEFIDAISQIG